MTIEEIEENLRKGKITEPFARNEAHKLGYTVRVLYEEYPDRTQHKSYQFVKYNKTPKPKRNPGSIDGPSPTGLIENKKYHCSQCGKESDRQLSGPCKPEGKKGRPFDKHDWVEK